MKKWLGRSALILLGSFLLVGLAFVWWAETPPPPGATAATAVAQAERGAFDGYYFLPPEGESAEIGFIFYPGGRVDAGAYADSLQAIAEQGILVAVAEPPLNLAVFSPNSATTIIAAFPHVQRWFIGGHSLGGAMAAYYVYHHPETVAGLVLWASYPAENNSLADRALPVLNISADQDRLSDPAKIAQSRALLPPETQYLIIAGGNHAQFGNYGEQSGDGVATIGREAQYAQLISATVTFLQQPR